MKHSLCVPETKWSRREDVVHTIIELIADNELYTN